MGKWGSGGGDFSLEPGAGGGTGPHLHFQWNSKDAAARYDNALHPHVAPPPATKPAAPDPGQMVEIHIHSHTHLDGREIAKNTTKHQTRMAAFPSQSPNFNRYSSPTAPDYGAIAFA